jgi:hypothetical protein
MVSSSVWRESDGCRTITLRGLKPNWMDCRARSRASQAQQQLHDQPLVLHEDVLDKLKALDPKPLIEATERKLTALIEERHEQVNRRLEPVERAPARSLRRRGRPS